MVIRPTRLTCVSKAITPLNQIAPSGPAIILSIRKPAGRGKLVNAPLGVMRIMNDVNVPLSSSPLIQVAPSDPIAIASRYICPAASSVGMGNSVLAPSGVTRPIAGPRKEDAEYQRLPSGAAVNAFGHENVAFGAATLVAAGEAVRCAANCV